MSAQLTVILAKNGCLIRRENNSLVRRPLEFIREHVYENPHRIPPNAIISKQITHTHTDYDTKKNAPTNVQVHRKLIGDAYAK